MSSFNFVRQKAGEYNITKNSQFVGKIKKLKASKWIVTDVVDTPQHVTKTLKEAKDAVVNLIIFEVPSQEVDNTSEDEYDTFVEVDKVTTEQLEGSLNFYKQTAETDELVKVSSTEFGFPGPTLEPVMF